MNIWLKLERVLGNQRFKNWQAGLSNKMHSVGLIEFSDDGKNCKKILKTRQDICLTDEF